MTGPEELVRGPRLSQSVRRASPWTAGPLLEESFPEEVGGEVRQRRSAHR